MLAKSFAERIEFSKEPKEIYVVYEKKEYSENPKWPYKVYGDSGIRSIRKPEENEDGATGR